MSRVTRNSGKGYRHNRQLRPQHQIDLFGNGLSNDATGAPAWPELPAEAQAALTSLMTQLILDHAATPIKYCTIVRAARYEKALRGELVVAAPVGFVKAGDRYEKDRRVQEAIKLVFDKVGELGSTRRALLAPRVQPRFVGEAVQRRHGLALTELLHHPPDH